jgi:hypothetical protein
MDKAEFVRMEFLMEPSSLTFRQAMQLVIVKNGRAEDLVNLLLASCNLKSADTFRTVNKHLKNLRTFVKSL